MVDIQSIVGSSHPSDHGQGNEQEATSCSRVAWSLRIYTRDATMAVVAITGVVHRQHSAATVAITPPAAGPEGTREVSRVLHCNPLGLSASPSIVE
jgi:hypothetical protein